MVGAVQCIYTCWGLSSKFESLSLTSSSQPNVATDAAFRPLGFSANTSLNIFSRDNNSLMTICFYKPCPEATSSLSCVRSGSYKEGRFSC